MGLVGLLARYLTHRLIPWKPAIFSATVWVDRQ